MTKGPCMLGKLNHYLGSRAADEGRAALYPEIDFCKSWVMKFMLLNRSEVIHFLEQKPVQLERIVVSRRYN